MEGGEVGEGEVHRLLAEVEVTQEREAARQSRRKKMLLVSDEGEEAAEEEGEEEEAGEVVSQDGELCCHDNVRKAADNSIVDYRKANLIEKFLSLNSRYFLLFFIVSFMNIHKHNSKIIIKKGILITN